MKRSGPLRRKTPLRRVLWAARGRGRLRATGASDGPEKGAEGLKTAPDPALSRSARQRWRHTIVGHAGKRNPCAICGSRQGVQAHHVIAKQHLKRFASERKLAGEVIDLRTLLWDSRNGLPLCEKHHSRHETAYRRVPRSKLRKENFQFAEEINMMHRIERTYPDE